MRTIRTAIVTGGADSLKQVKAYLPYGYSAVEIKGYDHEAMTETTDIVIVGRDVAGWTLDDYVIPRLASGLIFAEEVK